MREDHKLEMSIDRNLEEANELLKPEFRRKRTIRWFITALLGVLIYYLLWDYYWFRWTLILYVPYKLINIIPLIFWQTYTKLQLDRIETEQKQLSEIYTKPMMFNDILYTPGEYVKTKPDTPLEEDGTVVNWTGKILELNSADNLCLIELDSKSLLSLHDTYLMDTIEDGGDVFKYVFSLNELIKTQRRDTDEQYEKTKAKIEARLWELEGPDEEEQYFKSAKRWEEQFCESTYMDTLTKYQVEHAGFIVNTFLDYMYNYEGATLNNCDSYDVQGACLGPIPGKITGEIELFENYGTVLISFFKFMEEQGHISNAIELIKAVEEIKHKIPKVAGDSSNWGIAKSLMMGAQNAGVDMSDTDALNRYMTSQSIKNIANVMELPVSVSKPDFDNIGRNDRITVKYKNGKQVRDIKFKKVEQDLLDGKCEIIG